MAPVKKKKDPIIEETTIESEVIIDKPKLIQEMLAHVWPNWLEYWGANALFYKIQEIIKLLNEKL
jgi:hypothetical protein